MISTFNLICSEPVESKRACQTFCAFPQNQDTLRCGMYVELCACAIVCMAVLLIVKQLNNVCSCVFCGDINHLHRCLWRCFCRPFFSFGPWQVTRHFWHRSGIESFVQRTMFKRWYHKLATPWRTEGVRKAPGWFPQHSVLRTSLAKSLEMWMVW